MRKFSKNPICYPDYNHSILGISNSILQYFGAKTHYPTLPILDESLNKKYKNVVFMIFDGLGVDLLKNALPPFSFLRKNIKDKITSVFPPTTTAATTSYYSAIAPVTHSWLGWAPYFREHDKIVELFSNKELYFQQPLNAEPVINQMLYEHIFAQIQKVNSQVTTTEIFPPFRPNGVKSIREQCDSVIAQAQKEGAQFVLTYWTEPDHCAHKYGPYSKEVKKQVKEINACVKKMSKELTDTLIIISADHGLLPIKKIIYIDEYKDVMDCLAVPLNLDDRVSAIFLKENKEADFLSLFKKYFSKDFILIKSESAVEQGLFGKGKITPKALDFLGNYLIIAISDKSLKQRIVGMSVDPDSKGAHAGLTKLEMMVPLIIIDNK